MAEFGWLYDEGRKELILNTPGLDSKEMDILLKNFTDILL